METITITAEERIKNAIWNLLADLGRIKECSTAGIAYVKRIPNVGTERQAELVELFARNVHSARIALENAKETD